MSITRPLGFLASASKAGLKPSGKPDVALIVRELIDDAGDRQGTAMAFTRNQLIGAPVVIGRELRRRTLAGDLSPPGVVLINAGNSNAATGDQGIADARRTCEVAAKLLARPTDAVIPSSTGVIGRLLPVQKIVDALPTLVNGLARGDGPDLATAQAIMTTDNVHKSAFRSLTIDGFAVQLGAIAKGAGMIAPRLDSASRAATPSATMLAFITTDAAISSEALQRALDLASDSSFNRITVDNHASCSDTVIAMSSGLATRASGTGGDDSGVLMRPLTPGSPGFVAFSAALAELCADLSHQIVRDGEGATRTFTVTVKGAPSDEDADRIAREVVNSPLVKCAVHGRDPNWGRVVTAAGNAGVPFDATRASLDIGPVAVFANGRPIPEALDNPALKIAVSADDVRFTLSLNSGGGSGWMTGCDLTTEYVRINADYTT